MNEEKLIRYLSSASVKTLLDFESVKLSETANPRRDLEETLEKLAEAKADSRIALLFRNYLRGNV